MGLGLGLHKTNMLHLSFMSHGQVMSKNYAGEIVSGAPTVMRSSMACSFDCTVHHLHVCVVAGIDADDHHCHAHKPTCA